MSDKFSAFIEAKLHYSDPSGFKPVFIPDALFDFQKALLEWSVMNGRAAIFADAGMGKTAMQLAWAQNVVQKTNKRVLIATPLAVSAQTVREGEKFGIECHKSSDGKTKGKIIVTNYERLHHFDSNDFGAMIGDESGILKNYDGSIKAQVTEFMRKLPYRLLCTATPSPNDYIELGTSSEALGDMGYMDMLSAFFKHDQNSNHPNRKFEGEWRFRGHSERDFWRWVCSWARAVRKPSDLGFPNQGFDLPPLTMHEHIVKCTQPLDGFLFADAAKGLHEQRQERRKTIVERCEKAAERAQAHDCSISWCHLNDEGDMLEKLIRGAVQVSGKDSDDFKEEAFMAFALGKITHLVSKPVIAGFGLNWQHCAHQTFFPSHSFEQWYQAIRRSWRFGQKREVTIDIITSEGELGVLKNLKRKAEAADRMFAQLIELMNDQLHRNTENQFTKPTKLPSWLN